MANRLASATSPYLLQHAENPVDWWEWGPEAFAEAKRRDAPVLLSVGYAACHWCHVMAHESFEDEATAAYLNEHFVSIKVDREERPDVDAVYMHATTAMTGHGGWPMTVRARPRRQPVLRRHLLPRPAAARPAALPAGARGALRRLATTARGRAAGGRPAPRAPAARRPRIAAGRDRPRRRWPTRGATCWRASYDAARGGFGGAPKFPPSMVLEFLLRRRPPGRAARCSTRTCEAMARGGLYDQLGGGFARYSVDAGWVVPHFEKMLYDNAQLLGLYARVGRRRSATGSPARPPTSCSASCAPPRAASPPRWTPTARAWRASSTSGRPPSWSRCSGRRTAPGRRRLLEVTEAGTFEHGSSTLQLLAGPRRARRGRLADVRRRLLAARARARPPGPRRQGGRGLERTRDQRSVRRRARCSASRRYVDAAVAAGELLVRRAPGRRPAAPGLARRRRRHATPACWRTTAASRPASSRCVQATGDAVWLERARRLLDDALDRFRADDGGFFDTAADAEALVARPRDPADNASPSGLSVDGARAGRRARADRRGPLPRGRRGGAGHGRAAGRAGAALRRLVAGRRRRRWHGGPLEIAVVGPRRRGPRRPGARAPAGTRAPSWSWPTARATTSRCSPGGRRSTAGPAAYVCRGFVCERPVTTVAELERVLGS